MGARKVSPEADMSERPRLIRVGAAATAAANAQAAALYLS